MPTKGGIKIGKDNDNDKWQCKICKRKNTMAAEVCSFCDEPRESKGL